MDRPEWLATLKRYEGGDSRRSLLQFLGSLVSYLALFAAMILALRARWPWWSLLLVALPASGFLVRIFIVLHDCGHDSFSGDRRLNAAVGYLCGLLTFSSFPDFRRSHAIHHATVGNLDRRGVGDVWTMTVAEYRAAGPARKALYRFTRNPFVLYLLLAPLDFLVLARFPHSYARRSDNLGTLATDLGIAVMVTAGILAFGAGPYLLVQGLIMYLASMAGVWLFYIQHQYAEVYWRREKDWSRVRASLEGSSHYDLPPLLRFFSGNIGYHHIHHLDPRIPNYRLKACSEAVSGFAAVKPIGLREGFRSLRLHLYDEEKGRLVAFRDERRDRPRFA